MGLAVIGIVAHRMQPEHASYVVDAQYGDYAPAVAMAGGAPLLIPIRLNVEAWRSIYERLDGLLFPGGVDVAPAFYRESPHPQLGRVDDDLDYVELTLARWALAERMPVLAICRGIQLINVAAGGTLYQDLPAQYPVALPHACPGENAAHKVRVQADTRLAAALGVVECSTNSRHHQAVKDVAPGFVATAWAPDGVIEGIEMADAPFVVGVQWHPENLAAHDERMLGLFKAFVQACRR